MNKKSFKYGELAWMVNTVSKDPIVYQAEQVFIEKREINWNLEEIYDIKTMSTRVRYFKGEFLYESLESLFKDYPGASLLAPLLYEVKDNNESKFYHELNENHDMQTEGNLWAYFNDLSRKIEEAKDIIYLIKKYNMDDLLDCVPEELED